MTPCDTQPSVSFTFSLQRDYICSLAASQSALKGYFAPFQIPRGCTAVTATLLIHVYALELCSMELSLDGLDDALQEEGFIWVLLNSQEVSSLHQHNLMCSC